MGEQLRVLIVEDSEDDAALMTREIRRAGFDPRATRVETAAALQEALAAGEWDIVVSDYALPSFSGLEALRIVQERGLDLPFIIASGAISEETAVAAMRAGAHDYVLKDKLARLGPAITRELREARLRAERRRVAEELARVREESAAEIRRSRDQLDVVLRGIAEGVMAENASGRLVYVNEIAASLAGFASSAELIASPSALRGNDFELYDEAGTLLSTDQLPSPRARAAGERFEKVMRSCHRVTGVEQWFIVTSVPIFDEQHQLAMVITIFRDITEQKRAEAEARYLADASKVFAVASLDYAAIVASIADTAVQRLADWCAVEVIDDEMAEQTQVAAAHKAPGSAEAIRTLLRDHPRVFHALFESADVLPPGEIRRQAIAHEDWLRCSQGDPAAENLLTRLKPRAATKISLSAHGRAFGTLTLVSTEPGRDSRPDDLPLAREMGRRASLALENARLYRRARAAIAARDEFLSIASHELRTPLTALTLRVQGLRRFLAGQRPGGPEAAVETADHALRQIQRLTGLVESLLDISRAAVGRLVLERQKVDLSEVVRGVVERIADEALDAGCAVVVAADKPVVGNWDRLRIEQVVTNLISNALKYGGGKPIEIAVSGDAENARFTVQDHGIGIAPKDLPRIFQRFERAVSARYYGGLGLGLFIAKQIVDAHDGSIGVESEPGAGSKFVVCLPRHAAASELARGAEAPASN